MLLPIQAPIPSGGHWYSLTDVCEGQHHLRHCSLDIDGIYSDDHWPLLQATVREGWVKDPEGNTYSKILGSASIPTTSKTGVEIKIG